MGIWHDALLAIQTRIRGLDLGVDPERVAIQSVPVNVNIFRGQARGLGDGSLGIILSPTQEQNNGGTNATVRLDLGVSVVIWQAHGGSLDAGLPDHLRIRQAILQEFDQQPFPGVDGIFKSRVTPGTLFSLATWKMGYDVHAMTIRLDACLERAAHV